MNKKKKNQLVKKAKQLSAVLGILVFTGVAVFAGLKYSSQIEYRSSHAADSIYPAGYPPISTLAPASGGTIGFILVNFANDTSKPVNTNKITTWVTGQATQGNPADTRSVREYYSVNSNGRYEFESSFYDWVTVDMKPTDANGCLQDKAVLEEMSLKANNILKTKLQTPDIESKFSRLVYIAYPKCQENSGSSNGKNKTYVINPTTPDSFKYLTIHELGHTFGLGHATDLVCKENDKLVSISDPSNCTATSYLDPYDGMGGNYAVYQPDGEIARIEEEVLTPIPYSISNRRLLGWIDPKKTILAPVGKSQYTIANLPAPGGQYEEIVIPRGDGRYYFLEFRKKNAFDNNNRVPDGGYNGVAIRKDVPVDGYYPTHKSTSFIDATPTTKGITVDGVFVSTANRNIFEDKRTGIKVTITSSNADSAQVQVERQALPACQKKNPEIIVPGDGKIRIKAGPANISSLELTLKNPDSVSCDYAEIYIDKAVTPSGFVVNGDSPEILTKAVLEPAEELKIQYGLENTQTLTQGQTFQITLPFRKKDGTRDIKFTKTIDIIVEKEPEIGGVLNAASFQTDLPVEGITALFGADMSSTSCVKDATALPLPTELCGTTVVWNSTDDADLTPSLQPKFPLFFVSKDQINFQLSEISLRDQGMIGKDIFIRVCKGSSICSKNKKYRVNPVAPGMFSTTSNGKGDAVAINIEDNGSASRHGDGSNGSKKVMAGKFLALFVTGLGQSNPAVKPGVAGAGESVTAPVVTIGGKQAEILFVGKAPGLVGIEQINIRIPALSAGRQLLKITSQGKVSNELGIYVEASTAGANTLNVTATKPIPLNKLPAGLPIPKVGSTPVAAPELSITCRLTDTNPVSTTATDFSKIIQVTNNSTKDKITVTGVTTIPNTYFKQTSHNIDPNGKFIYFDLKFNQSGKQTPNNKYTVTINAVSQSNSASKGTCNVPVEVKR